MFVQHLHGPAAGLPQLTGLALQGGFCITFLIPDPDIVPGIEAQHMEVTEGLVKAGILFNMVHKKGYIEFIPDHHFRQIDHFGQPFIIEGIGLCHPFKRARQE